jgi:DNA-nicking Smr family endonuclease
MTAKRRGGDEDREAFEAAMEGVVPMPPRGTAAPPPPRRSGVPREREPREPVRFEITRVGERIEALAPGIDRKHLRKLRQGGVAVELRVDLHGLHGSEARDAVREALLDAAAAGRRCALVIHGRGRHSQGEAVLKESLPGWLAEPPLGEQVMAFASAAPADGGSGATYVLLRRRVVRNAG